LAFDQCKVEVLLVIKIVKDELESVVQTYMPRGRAAPQLLLANFSWQINIKFVIRSLRSSVMTTMLCSAMRMRGLAPRMSITKSSTPCFTTSISRPMHTIGLAKTNGLKHASQKCTLICQAIKKKNSASDDIDNLPERGGNGNIIGSSGIFLLWAGLGAYAFLLSPNQTPLRDQYFIEKLVGLTSDAVPLNTVFYYLFFIMGIWPLIYTALLVPAAKSRNGVPAWPFFTLSYAVGAFGLLPFMALWQPLEKAPKLPPKKEDLEGIGNLLGRGMESPILPWALLGGSVFCIGSAATAGGAAWQEYFRLLQESRLVHVTTLDFLTLTTLAPFWMDNDAQLRNWEGRDKLLPILSFIPVVGPALYLCLRPKAEL
jgi:hypothetical protein